MTQNIGPSHAEETAASPPATSRAAPAVTRTLLACGVAATPLFVVVATTQILTRDGFDLRRHVVSMLSNGDLANGFPPAPRRARPPSRPGTAGSISPLRRWRTSR